MERVLWTTCLYNLTLSQYLSWFFLYSKISIASILVNPVFYTIWSLFPGVRDAKLSQSNSRINLNAMMLWP